MSVSTKDYAIFPFASGLGFKTWVKCSLQAFIAIYHTDLKFRANAKVENVFRSSQNG